MRPFKMFFGLAIGIILFLFVAKILVYAFVAAVVMSILYALIRRIVNFIQYDPDGSDLPFRDRFSRRMENEGEPGVEPLFYTEYADRSRTPRNIHFIDAV